MSTRIIVNGANGKMGQLAVMAINEHPDLTLVGTTQRNDDLAAEIKKNKAHIVIDFTCADSVLKNARTIINAAAHPIIGTSGLLPDQVKSLQADCTKLKLGGIIVPNFSLAAVLMMKYAQEIARHFSQAEIIEMHHAEKLDSPSGTSIHTAERIAEARLHKTLPAPKNHETMTGARGATYQQVPIHSIRLPGIMAQQQVIFGSEGETLTIGYNTIDRRCYAQGIRLACKKVLELNELVYGLEHII